MRYEIFAHIVRRIEELEAEIDYEEDAEVVLDMAAELETLRARLSEMCPDVDDIIGEGFGELHLE